MLPVDVLLKTLLEILRVILIVYAIMSWIPSVNRNSPFVKLMASIVEPMCKPVRKIIPPASTGNVDLSVLVLLLAISLVQRLL